MRPGDRHLLLSVTKAFTSAIAGILELRGELDLTQSADAVIGELTSHPPATWSSPSPGHPAPTAHPTCCAGTSRRLALSLR